MVNYKIKCEVVQIVANKFKCSTLGQTFVIGPRTPEGMCARAYAAIYPASLAMRFSDDISWEPRLFNPSPQRTQRTQRIQIITY